MSVDQLPPGKARPAKSAAQFVRYEEFIDRQIESTRRTVKIVDVLTALLTIVVGTMAFLLVAAVVEHWLLPGGFNVAVRLLLFALLFTCLTFYSTRKLWPLLRGSINPAYAAQAIEQDNPSLKNSLLNLLLFRQHRDDVTDAVYETLEEQAATRLHRVPIEAAVDRTNLLRLGYALIGILAVVALYKILSPKDPFASAERVLMPWARIAAPSRVSIENIAPGHVTLSRGELLKVAADVRGIGEDDPVVVKFTTADGQAVDRPAAMKPDAASLRFQGSIPPEGDAGLGVAQDLRYYIEAGDARSLEYKVTVISAPTITVERVDYDYPDYTGFADRSIERLGDIRAIEGTRVTIHARANQSIDEAAIDFQADGRRDVSFRAEGEQARATFTLELRDDRETPKFTSYVLRFTGSDGRPNRDPVKHPIDVVPDYRPEAAILTPKEKTRDVRLDESVAIEIEARDPDFALADVRLTGESAGRTVFNAQLLAKSHNGRFVGRLTFTPGEHELHAGDVVRYWVTARDNRAPQANEATTDSQTFRIVGPDPRQPGQPPQDRIAQRAQPEQRDQQQQDGEQPKEQGQQGDQQDQRQGQDKQQGQEQSGEGEQGQSGGESSDSSQGGEQGESQESGESSSSEGSSGENGEQGSANESGENGQGENSQNQQGEQQSGGRAGGEGESSASEQGGESGQSQQRPGGKQESGQGTQTGDPQQGSQEGEQADSLPSRENGQGSQNNTQNGGEDAPARESGDSSPVSSEGDNDGEAFERIQNFLKDQGQLPKESQQQESENQQSSGEQGPHEQGEQGKQPGESSDRETSEGQSADGESQSGESESGANEQLDQGKQGGESQGSDQTSSENGQSPRSEAESGGESSPSKNEQSGTESATSESGEKTKEPSAASDQQQPGGGQETQSEGESGAGNQAEQGKAPPDSPNAKSNEKWQQDPSSDNQGEQQEQSDAGRGERQSDSHGEQGGEQTGAAEENNSQKSERDGTGSSGQNQSADEGMGESSEQGAGRNSSSGGQDAKANERTGESSEDMQGEGSQQRQGQGSQPGGKPGSQQGQKGEQQGEQQGESQSGEQRKQQQGKQPGEQGQQGEQQDPSQSGEQELGGEQGANSGNDRGEDAPARDGENNPSNEQQGGQRSGASATDGAGRVPEGVMQPSGATGDAPGADAANLEFARRETDLVLETLADQMKRQKVDKRLLDKLGWTEADMKRFVERWQQLKAAADANNPDANEAQRELDDALRSLGLRRGEMRQSTVTDDQNRNLRQGYRGAVPLEYQERLRAYNQGVSRARQDAE